MLRLSSTTPSAASGIALTMLLALAPAAASAQVLIPPFRSPRDALTADDLSRMGAAAERLYRQKAIGTIERWRSLDNGHAGSVKLMRQFRAQDMSCYRLEYDIRFRGADEQTHTYLVNWCRTPTGEWKLLETGR